MLTLTKTPRTQKVYVYRATSNTKSKRAKAGRANLFKQTIILVLIAAGLLMATPKNTDEVVRAASAENATATEAVANAPTQVAAPGTVDATLASSDAPIDNRVEKLEGYLRAQRSPFAGNAADFINAADQYSLDWKLLPAISGVESGFGRAYIIGTYNAWGWGGGYIAFGSWTNAINTIAKGLRENYANHGLITPAQIAPVYAPPSYTWAANVQMYMDQIEKF